MNTPIYNAKFAAERIKLLAQEPFITAKQPIILQNKPKTFTI